MLIAIDYDGTYTADPALFREFIELAQASGHRVICVTMRSSAESIEWPFGEVFYTCRMAKAKFLNSLGVTPDVWIDDSPHWIHFDSA